MFKTSIVWGGPNYRPKGFGKGRCNVAPCIRSYKTISVGKSCFINSKKKLTSAIVSSL